MQLANGDLMYAGIVYPGKHRAKEIIFDVEKWIQHWNNAIIEIKTMSLDYSEIVKIHGNFLHEVLSYQYSVEMQQRPQDVDQISTNLTIAFCKTYANYRESKGKFFWFISGFFAKRIMDKLNMPKLPSIK
ncbi:Uncharacterised protein [uncultured archaeon]|nr:Uncharacterised protein [uncultured archaeon]